MMVLFSPSSRKLWLFVSAASYAATFCGFDDRLGAAEVPAVSMPASAGAYRSTDPPVESIVRRDPFAGAISATYIGIASKTEGDVTVPDIVPRYVDQIAFDQTPKTEATALSVSATITGSRPVAYVEVGDTLTIVRVSDTVAGKRVVAIDLRGLQFSDGTRLDLSGTSIHVPRPSLAMVSHRPDTLLREFQRLRQLVLARTSAAPNSTPTPPPTASQRPPASVVTPGPLRTVDPRGIAVGTTPTPDVDAPTAFPIPYPYPPRPR